MNFILVSLAIFNYREHFPFWEYPFSTLGETVTVSGFPNENSLFIFNISMILSGVIMSILAIAFLEERRAQNRISKVVLCLICAVGFFITSSPHDTHRWQHIYGTAVMLGSLWGLCLVFLTELKQIVSKRMLTLGQLVLQIPVLSYAFLFFINSPKKQIAQKFAVVGIFTILAVSSTIAFNYSQKFRPNKLEMEEDNQLLNHNSFL